LKEKRRKMPSISQKRERKRGGKNGSPAPRCQKNIAFRGEKRGSTKAQSEKRREEKLVGLFSQALNDILYFPSEEGGEGRGNHS